MNGNKTQEFNKKKKWYIISGIIILCLFLVVLYILISPKEEICTKCTVSISYIGMSDNGYLMMKVDYTPRESSLNEIFIQVYNNTYIPDPESGLSAQQAKQNYLNINYPGNITYNDVDNDNKFSEGDIIMIKDESIGGLKDIQGGEFMLLYGIDKIAGYVFE